MNSFAKTCLMAGIFIMLFVGCTVSDTCELSNFSGSAVRVTVVNKDGPKDLGIVLPGESIKIHNWIWNEVRIEKNSAVKQYVTPEPPYDCIEDHGWGLWYSRVFRAVLRQDEKIYLKCKSQSSEFPISPTDINGHNKHMQTDAGCRPRG